LNVLARALALPVQPGLVIGVHLPAVPRFLIEAAAFCIHLPSLAFAIVVPDLAFFLTTLPPFL
jgi:hypothetical protein